MPGISVSKICVPFGGGGINWSSYWATRKPSALIVTGMRDTEIDFSWTDNSAGEASFKIYKSTDGVTYSADGTTVAGDTTYTATGLTAGTLYYFYVVGVKNANESDPTNIYDTRFKITVDTTKAGSASDTFILPLYKAAGTTYDCYVDWGDGGAEEHISGSNLDPVTHDYNQEGTFQIKIRGTFPQYYQNNAGDKAKVISIDNWGNIKWAKMSYAYRGCANMNGTYMDVPNFSSVAAFDGAFMGCSIFNWPVNFYTAVATNMGSMFASCAEFNQSVSSFNTANVTNMSSMFNGCAKFNQAVNHFDTTKVTTMSGMFTNCILFNQPVSNFNTANVTSMANMFGYCYEFNQSVANFNTEKVTAMNGMFVVCNSFNQDISNWNFEAITGTGLTDFISNSTQAFSTDNYDAVLIAMASQSLNSGVTMKLYATYTPGGAAEAARTTLTTTYSWVITDDGPSF